MAAPLFPAYFFPGPEIRQKKDRIKGIRNTLAGIDGQDPEEHRFYPYDIKVAEVISLLRNGSLFSARRLVILADVHALKAGDITLISEYLKAPSPETLLIFTTDYLPGAREYPSKLANILPKNAVQIFWEMFERDKRGWVRRFFQEKGIKANNDALSLLIDLSEGTRDALQEACEQLCFSADPSVIIGEEDVDRVLENNRSETVYSIFDRFCRRDLAGLLDAYRKMIYSVPANADRILTMFFDPLIKLRDFKTYFEQGLSPDFVAKKIGLRGGKRALKTYSDGVQNFTTQELNLAVRDIIDLEAWLRTVPRDIRSAKTELWFCGVIGRQHNEPFLNYSASSSGS